MQNSQHIKSLLFSLNWTVRYSPEGTNTKIYYVIKRLKIVQYVNTAATTAEWADTDLLILVSYCMLTYTAQPATRYTMYVKHKNVTLSLNNSHLGKARMGSLRTVGELQNILCCRQQQDLN